jgi:hypothetical protein
MRPSKHIAPVLLLALALPTTALAVGDGSIRIVRNGSGFDKTAVLRSDGRALTLSGPVRCTSGGRIRIDVTVTQRSTGSLARGTWRGRCRGSAQRWRVPAARALTGAFDGGQITACAAAAAANATRATDATQWCRVVSLRR